MAPYDSDSSEGEEGEYTETNVLLGYASKEADDDTISRLGGRPEWLDPTAPPSAALAKCKICKDLMVLLLQLNGELPDRFPGHERRLYVLSCMKKSCRRKDGSIRALRGMRIAAGSKTEAPKKELVEEKRVEKEKGKAPANLGDTLFGVKTMGSLSSSANPFATSSAPSSSNPFVTSTNPFSAPRSTENKIASEKTTEKAAELLPKTFAETLKLNNDQVKTGPPPPPEPWPAEKDLPKPYPISYLAEADYETLDPTPPSVSQKTVQMDIDDPASSSGGGKEDRQVFESSMDADFQKFADRLSQNPEQVIRYEFGGQPLLYSKKDAVGELLGGTRGMPRCGNCGSGRTFEVQMTPNAITELEADEMDFEGMDWGTVIVGVCKADCQESGVGEGAAGYLEEWVGVQWEEMVRR